MKKLLYVFSILLMGTSSWGQDVSVSEAATVASRHLIERGFLHEKVSDVNGIEYGKDTCLYTVSFESGIWYIISADKRVTPILAYGSGPIADEDAPEALHDLMSKYGTQISNLKNSNNSEIKGDASISWGKLLGSPKAIPSEYSQSDILLDKTNRGILRWGQSFNNNGTCTPSYNMACEEDESCNCSHKPVGCGAVALGMVMWYWQWPRTSSEIHCDWDLIPPELKENTPSDEVEELTHFLRDCGRMVDMTYWCAGSWCFIWNINEALHELGYNSSVCHRASEWTSTAWNDLLKSEISNNRPVIYYGEPGCEVWHGHYFVIDGYNNEGKFHVNFGHRYSDGWFYLDDIVEDDASYNDKQFAIVGISPTYNDENITQLPYVQVAANRWRTEYAFNSINIPAQGESLTTQNGSEMLLEAGEEVSLNDGFEAKAGSTVDVAISPRLQSHMQIDIPYLPNAVTWGGMDIILL